MKTLLKLVNQEISTQEEIAKLEKTYQHGLLTEREYIKELKRLERKQLLHIIKKSIKNNNKKTMKTKLTMIRKIEEELKVVQSYNISKNIFNGAGWVQVYTTDKKVAKMFDVTKKDYRGEYEIDYLSSNGSIIWLGTKVKKAIEELNKTSLYHDTLYARTTLDQLVHSILQKAKGQKWLNQLLNIINK